MQIIDVDIEWYEGYANGPAFRISVDEDPWAWTDRLYWEMRKGDFNTETYRAALDDFGRFYVWTPQDTNGFGGATFKLKMVDGGITNLKGPWSSNSFHVNKMFKDRDPLCECVVLPPDGGSLAGIAVRVLALLCWYDSHRPPWGLAETTWGLQATHQGNKTKKDELITVVRSY